MNVKRIDLPVGEAHPESDAPDPSAQRRTKILRFLPSSIAPFETNFRRSLPWTLSETAALIVVLFLGIFWRLSGLANWHFNGDEISTIFKTAEPLKSILFEHPRYSENPPLRSVILHYMQHFGAGIIYLRSMSLLTGLLFLPICYVLARNQFGKIAALAMTLLAGVSYEHVIQSQVLRSYSLLLLLEIGALVFYLEAWRSGSLKSLTYFLAVALLGVFTHYSAAIWVFAFGAPLIVRFILARAYKPLAFLFLGLFCVVGVWSSYLMVQFTHTNALPERQHAVTSVLQYLALLADITHHLFYPLKTRYPILLTCSFLLGAYALVRTQRWDMLLPTAIVFISLSALGVAGAYPLYGSRYTLFLVPFYLLLLGASLPPSGWGKYPLASSIFFGLLVLEGMITLEVPNQFLWRPDAVRLQKPQEFVVRISDYRRSLRDLNQLAGTDPVIMSGSMAGRVAYDLGERHWGFGGYVPFKQLLQRYRQRMRRADLEQLVTPVIQNSAAPAPGAVQSDLPNGLRERTQNWHACWVYYELKRGEELNRCLAALELSQRRDPNKAIKEGQRAWFLGRRYPLMEAHGKKYSNPLLTRTTIVFPFEIGKGMVTHSLSERAPHAQ